MKYGLNCGPKGAGTWTEIRDAVGPFSGWRCYSTPDEGVPAAWPGTSSGLPPTGATFIIASIKPDIPELLSGSLDDRVRNYVAGAAKGDWLTCEHEGETQNTSAVDGHIWKPDEIKAMHAHMYKVVKAERPDIRYGQIVGGFSATPAAKQYPLGQWIARRQNGRRLDFYGIDDYRAAWNPKATAASTFGVAAAAIRKVVPGAVIAVNEVNSINPGRAAFLRDVYNWAKINKCPVFFPFFGDKYPWDPNDVDTILEMKRQAGSV
jgi:hypothetical protein